MTEKTFYVALNIFFSLIFTINHSRLYTLPVLNIYSGNQFDDKNQREKHYCKM